MSLDAQCPHCKEDFDVEDHRESGPYPCPACDQEIWIEVDYSLTYDARCMPSKHNWKHVEIKTFPSAEKCKNCHTVRLYPREGFNG